ncbi:LysR substrate-binding domain-containing protein [Ottowia thiooxydans]|uniref:LysR family cys regulon transcriptional activator n=1 Tax=Ottowia thiooxydans TaxID=219182 RepID=A0ABV2Q2V2_9BURK
MNLQQLRYLREVLRSGLSISEAARRLHTSQPGVSRQLRQLEEELNVTLFIRQRNAVVHVNPEAQPIIDLALRIADDLDRLLELGRQRRSELLDIRVAASHTLARYMVPRALRLFSSVHASTRINLANATPLESLEQVNTGQAHIAVTTELAEHFDRLAYIPCYLLPRVLIMPANHPLANLELLTMEALVKYPMIAYDRAFTGRNILDSAFARRNLTPNVTISAIGVDMVKSCVRDGLGIAIITSLSLTEDDRAALCVRSVDHLFEPTTVYAVFDKRMGLPATVRNFLLAFAPHIVAVSTEQLSIGEVDRSMAKIWVN